MNQAQELLSQILSNHLATIHQKRPDYSLRALALKLNLSPSHLSRVLRGQKGISFQSALRLIKELELTRAQSEEIINLYKTKNSKIEQKQHTQQILNLEVFRVIADWYHFAILELIKTKKFKHTEDYIAKRLSLDKDVVATAVNRLLDLGLIEKHHGKYHLTHAEMFETPDDIQSSAIKRHHTQMLDKAKVALLDQSTETREFQSLNLNFNVSSVEEAKKDIRKFIKNFNKKFAPENGEEIYQLNVQLFALTKEIT